MQGNYILINQNWHLVTQPELWEQCKSEEQYFHTLRERQLKKPQTILVGVTGKGKEELGF